MALIPRDSELDAPVTEGSNPSRLSPLGETFRGIMNRLKRILLDDRFGDAIGIAVELDGMLFRLKLWEKDVGKTAQIFQMIEDGSPELKASLEKHFSQIDKGLNNIDGILSRQTSSER